MVKLVIVLKRIGPFLKELRDKKKIIKRTDPLDFTWKGTGK